VAIDAAALDVAAENEHAIRMAVIRAAIPVPNILLKVLLDEAQQLLYNDARRELHSGRQREIVLPLFHFRGSDPRLPVPRALKLLHGP